MDPDPGGSNNIRKTPESTGLYLFKKGQKAGENGEEDEKEADISKSGVGLEHGNQSFSRVIMKKCVKQFDGTKARIDRSCGEKNAGKNTSSHPGTRFYIQFRNFCKNFF
jgi:hypothetical protein